MILQIWMCQTFLWEQSKQTRKVNIVPKWIIRVVIVNTAACGNILKAYFLRMQSDLGVVYKILSNVRFVYLSWYYRGQRCLCVWEYSSPVLDSAGGSSSRCLGRHRSEKWPDYRKLQEKTRKMQLSCMFKQAVFTMMRMNHVQFLVKQQVRLHLSALSSP